MNWTDSKFEIFLEVLRPIPRRPNDGKIYRYEKYNRKAISVDFESKEGRKIAQRMVDHKNSIKARNRVKNQQPPILRRRIISPVLSSQLSDISLTHTPDIVIGPLDFSFSTEESRITNQSSSRFISNSSLSSFKGRGQG